MAAVKKKFEGGGKKKKPAKKSDRPYEKAKKLARDKDVKVRSSLAEQDGLKPELLYFLAEDESVDVRRRVAANPGTPGQANVLLAHDIDEEVRCDLALKIGRLVPGLSDAESSRLQDLTLESLRILAEDQLPRVRQILAEEIKLATDVPKEVIDRLANDDELIVAAPVLEYSILLKDEDLLEIIAAGPIQGALAAIARRDEVSEQVSEAIVAAEDVPAIATLLANQNAQIREETLDKIIDQAKNVPSWHEPLVGRPSLSQRAIRRIAGFVTSALLDVLQERHQFDTETKKVVAAAVKKRLREESEVVNEAAERAKEMFEGGKLDDEVLRIASEEGKREFAIHALALKAELEPPIVRRMMESKAGKAVTALAWKAELSMRTAMSMQRHLAHIPPHAIVNAKEGVDYPLTEDEMGWYIDYFSG